MNKKGQALVEFIIIIPIFVMILLASVDLLNIMESKINLETTMEEVIVDKNYPLEDGVTLTSSIDNKYKTYKLSKKIYMTSPIMTVILGQKYNLEISRTVYE